MIRPLLIVAMGLLQLGDYLTSRAAFAHGAIETNPLLGYGTQPSDLTLAIAKVFAMCVFSMLVYRTKTKWYWAPVGVCLVYVAIVVNNYMLVAAR